MGYFNFVPPREPILTARKVPPHRPATHRWQRLSITPAVKVTKTPYPPHTQVPACNPIHDECNCYTQHIVTLHLVD